MLKNKTKMFLLFSLVLITMIGMTAISAAEDSASDAQISDASSQVGDTISDYASDNSNKLIEETGNTKTVKSEGESGTLSDLQSDIGSATTSITLEKDYMGGETETTPVTIDKNIIIDGNGKTITAKNGTFIISPEKDVTIKNVILTGKELNGSVIVNNGTLTLNNVTIKDLIHGTYQIASVLEAGANSLTLMDNVSISNITNSSTATRSAIYIDATATVTIQNSKLQDIYSSWVPIRSANAGSVLNMINTTINNLSGDSYGGAIYFNNAGTINIDTCIIENCTALYRGGAIYSKANTTIKNSIIRYNNLTKPTYNRGGAIWIEAAGYAPATLYLENNTLTPNEVIENDGVSIEQQNVTVISQINVAVANLSYEEGETVYAIAVVTDDNGNPISGRSVTFTINDKTYTATVINGSANATIDNLNVDDTYMVTASYSNALNQNIIAGKIEYGNVLPAMTNYNSMQEVINSQEAQAVVKLNNNITRAESEEKVIIDKDLTINGAKLVIDASQGTVFEITNGATVTIKDLTITNAESANVINVTNGNLVLDNVKIIDSTVTKVYPVEGLIAVQPGSTLVLNNSLIQNINGAVINQNASTVTVDNTAFNAIVGGTSNALVYVRDNFTFINSAFDNSSAYSAIFYSAASLPAFKMAGTMTVENSTFSNNNITQGNSVISMGNTTNISNCKFIANNATNPNSYCSALNIAGENAVMTVTDSVFINNTSAGDYTLAFVGYKATLNMSNCIILSDEDKPLFNYGTDSKTIVNGNYWGSNESPIASGKILTEIEEYDDWEEDFVTTQYDVTCDNWVVMNTTLTQSESNNMKYDIETKASSMDTNGQTSELTQSLPEYLDVTYTATSGRFDSDVVTLTNNVANNVFTSGLDASTVTVSLPYIEQTFELEAPVIDESSYFGLQLLIDGTADGQTFTLTKDCTRDESENNVTISNRNITIDGNGFTIDENNGRLFVIDNSDVTLKNLIIKNAGTTYNPSVLQIWTGNLVMENVTIINSTASSSGGALVYISQDSTARLNDVTFEDNTARFISNTGSTVMNNSVVKNTLISTSSMEYWAYNNGQLVIENTVFDNNTGYSGGINTGTSSTAGIVLNNVTFTNNVATNVGSSYGGLIHSQGQLTITNSRFENNKAQGTSGISGLLYVKGDTVVNDSTFINNSVKSTSTSSYSTIVGVFYLNGQRKTLNITRSTFINNTGASKGNVIYNYYGSFNVSNSVFIDNANDTYKVALHNYDTASYANNNWWGTNDSPRDFVYEQGSSYKIYTDNWVIMDATASEVADGQTTITTTLNKVTDVSGTVSDLDGTLPDGLEVTYDVATGTLVDSTGLTNGVSTATVQTSDDKYTVTVTQGYESIELTNEEAGDIIVTEDSYSQFFNDDGTAKAKIKAGSIVYISGQLANKTFIFNVPVTVTTYNETQADLTNANFIFNEGASGSNMTNIIINNTDYTEVAVFVNEATDMNITNNTITQTNNDGTTIGIAFNQTTGTTIEANTITVSGKTYPITSTPLLSRTAGIQGYNSSDNFVLDNDVTMVGLGNGGSASAQDSMIGIEVRGEYYIDYTTWDMGNDESNNNLVSDNRITVSGDVKYNYGIRFGNNIDGTIINNNTIDVTGTVYACGVETNKGDDIQILFNNITAVAANYTYGIYVSTGSMGAVNEATVYANYINVTAKDAYGIELFGPDETTVSENVIYATGDYSMGIGGYNSNENTITDNNITVIGDSSKDKQMTADSLGQDIVGIALLARSGTSDNVVTSNDVKVTDLAGSDAYAVTIKGEDNAVTENSLVGTNLMGDAAVNATEDNTVENNGPVGDVIITNDTYSQYFDENGVFKVSKQLEGSSVFLSGEFTDKNFVFNVPVNVVTAEDQAILNNSVITFNAGAVGSNISSIIINNKDYSEYVIYLDHVDDVTIENVTISQENIEGDVTHSIGIIYGENITIKDSTITTVGKCLNVAYDENYKSTVLTSSIYALATKALVIDSNTITTKQTGTAETYGTIEGLDLRGDKTYDEEEYEYVGVAFEDARIVNNVINTESTVYTYGLVFNDMTVDCLVDNNTFNSYSDYYSNGIEAFNTSKVNITNNIINANSAEFAYGIYLSGMYDWTNYETQATDFNYVAYNTIVCNSSVAYVIELYMSPSNTIEYNNLTANSNYSIGVAGADSAFNTISYNNIVLNNDMVQSTVPTYDMISSYPAGVKFVYGYMASPGNNTITFNNITINADTTDKVYTVNLTDTDGNTVTDNTLYGVNVCGSDSVIYEGEDNTVERNTPKSIDITMGERIGFIGQETNIGVSVIDEDGNEVQGGTVTFKDANGKVLGTSEVVDGVASIDVTFSKAVNTTIIAEYANDYTTAVTNNTLIVRKAETTITINEFTATVGEEVTITATVLDEAGNAVTNGKVVFKVNGKTLKDANGKVIYAKVTDGIATITYTVPEDWIGANITAVYSGSSKYEEASVDTAINMSETAPVLTIEPITDSVTIGTQVTLKASVTGTQTPLNTGKVVFKLNGKTLKDESGKVIYAKVVNGVATIENYIFTDVKAKTYTLSAVLISSELERLEDSTEITFVQ
jgi:hypothetical protein